MTVHPRVCGERGRTLAPHVCDFGSSPRVRGTRERAACDDVKIRFIPACAGNARDNSRGCQVLTVHPRVCGERGANPMMSSTTDGSSPRVRGTLAHREIGILMERFIPACAGNALNANVKRTNQLCRSRNWYNS